MQIFLSFAYEEDREQVNGFRSMLENPRANINFTDGSCKKDYGIRSDSAIKQYISTLIDQSSVTVCLISRYTKTSKWVLWELEASRSKGKGIVGIILKDKQNEIGSYSDCPAIIDGNRYKAYYWAEPQKLQQYIEEAERNRQ